jgi:hypothetical protein
MSAFELDPATSPAPGGSQSRDGGAGAAKRPKPGRHPVVDKPEFCLVVSPEADWPTLEIFPDIASLARRMRSLDGSESSVFPFFGIPVPFTAGPDRILQLPGGQPYPVFDFARYGQFVPNPNTTLPVDDTYLLARHELEGRPQSAVVDHRPLAGAGTHQEPDETSTLAAQTDVSTTEQRAAKQAG